MSKLSFSIGNSTTTNMRNYGKDWNAIAILLQASSLNGLRVGSTDPVPSLGAVGWWRFAVPPHGNW